MARTVIARVVVDGGATGYMPLAFAITDACERRGRGQEPVIEVERPSVSLVDTFRRSDVLDLLVALEAEATVNGNEERADAFRTVIGDLGGPD